MKKRAIIVLIMISAVAVKSQPNGGFEDWITEFSYQSPDQWQTLNFLSLTSPPNPLSAFKATGLDVHSGSYALRLETIYVTTNPYPDLIRDSMSGIFTGKINLSPFSYHYGFPYTGLPEKLKFWAKYSPVGNDIAAAGVILQRWNGLKSDTLATGVVDIMSSSDYNLYEITITYFLPGLLPDSATIVFGSSNSIGATRVGSTLFVDDVSFSGWVGIDDQKSKLDKVDVFPNPAKELLNISTEIKTAENVRILDLSGRLISIHKFQDKNVSVNTSQLSAGAHFYEVIDNKGYVLAKGSFEVIK